MKSKILGLMAAAGMLFAASCVKDTTDPYMSGDEVSVSFTLTPEILKSAATRSDDDGHVQYPEEGQYAKISDGTKADILIYAIYAVDYDEKTEEYTNPRLLEQYGRGTVGNVPEWIKAGEGQTVIKIDDEKPFPYTIQFRLVRDQHYAIAFWAQSSECKAYDTQNLRKVEVRYSEFKDDDTTGTATPNNDERRDAFCKVENFKAVDDGSSRHIDLYRPLAQINVGTSGFDYEIVTRGALSKKYKYSKIQLGNAARYLDVVTNEVLKTTTAPVEDSAPSRPEVLTTVDYSWARIPAYINFDNDSEFDITDLDPSKVKEGEVFLEINNLDGDPELAGYVSLEDFDEDGDNYTETFKYLSMCYVLVPDSNGTEVEYTTTLDNVTVWLATDEDGTDGVQIIDLTNVPVHRNWRTNIIGQSLLTDKQTLTIDISPIYSGDFNTGDYGQTWSGALSDGVSYDAENDRILISNANGLIWLQKMVNGKYEYYIWDKDNSLPNSTATDNEITSMAGVAGYYNKLFKSSGIEDPTTSQSEEYKDMSKEERENLKRRILKATHEKEWPANNNFHFAGATVRLTHDLDMTGVDWIPIGFDCRIKENNKKDHGFNVANAYEVGFCGTFDGGSHTIRNLTNHEFSSVVHEYYNTVPDECTNYRTDGSNKKIERIDTPQWYPVGLFGQIGGNDVTIQNVKLSNINLRGHHGGGAIAGFVGGEKVTIKNCYVDGGSITLTPMYRGDWINRADNNDDGRTFARAVGVGGIIGVVDTDGGEISNCDLRNLDIVGYRKVGGIIGEVITPANISVANNQLGSISVIAYKFRPYDCYRDGEATDNSVTRYLNGYGYILKQDPLSDVFVGGDKGNNVKNYASNMSADVVNVEYGTQNRVAVTDTRTSTIKDVRLEKLPMLSSWFTDEVTLASNFYGTASAYKKLTWHEFTRQIYKQVNKKKDEVYKFPFNLPFDLTPDFVTTSGQVGMYVEEIKLSGSGVPSGRAVISANGLTGEDDCVMYISSRGEVKQDFENAPDTYTHETHVDHVVVRGNPYAYTGICFAPNESTDAITLNTVSVYDVYQTLALDEGADPSNTALTVTDSNLRGYVDCGKGWKSVTFNDTVFGSGAVTGEESSTEETYTCKVTSDTTFDACWFKAPYIIDIAEGVTVTFTNKSYATAATDRNIELTTQTGGKIVIGSDSLGNATVTYGE